MIIPYYLEHVNIFLKKSNNLITKNYLIQIIQKNDQNISNLQQNRAFHFAEYAVHIFILNHYASENATNSASMMMTAHTSEQISVRINLSSSLFLRNPMQNPIIHGRKNAAISERACKISSIFLYPTNQISQLPTVRGNGITSRMFDTPVRYITQRSNPRPKPAWRAEPYFLRSR